MIDTHLNIGLGLVSQESHVIPLTPQTPDTVLYQPSHALPLGERDSDAGLEPLPDTISQQSDTILGRPCRTEGQMMGDLALISALGGVKAARRFKQAQRERGAR